MNASNAKDYLPLVQALAEGKTIQMRCDDGGWVDVSDLGIDFTEAPHWYRIKPEPKKGWYRVALMQRASGKPYTHSVDWVEEEAAISAFKHFLRWLTPRIEYEITE